MTFSWLKKGVHFTITQSPRPSERTCKRSISCSNSTWVAWRTAWAVATMEGGIAQWWRAQGCSGLTAWRPEAKLEVASTVTPWYAPIQSEPSVVWNCGMCCDTELNNNKVSEKNYKNTKQPNPLTCHANFSCVWRMYVKAYKTAKSLLFAMPTSYMWGAWWARHFASCPAFPAATPLVLLLTKTCELGKSTRSHQVQAYLVAADSCLLAAVLMRRHGYWLPSVATIHPQGVPYLCSKPAVGTCAWAIVHKTGYRQFACQSTATLGT